jgi:hypothetical protein
MNFFKKYIHDVFEKGRFTLLKQSLFSAISSQLKIFPTRYELLNLWQI